MIIIKLDCDFIITPRILFNDKNLSRTDIDILSLIISLTFKYRYCYACNDKLAKYVNTSIRTISDSLSKLRKLNYIIVKSEYKNRRIYINQEKIPMKSANDVATKCDDIAENCSQEVAESCYHNINNKYKNNNKYNYKKIALVPKWLEDPSLCEAKLATPEEQAEMEELLKEFKK